MTSKKEVEDLESELAAMMPYKRMVELIDGALGFGWTARLATHFGYEGRPTDETSAHRVTPEAGRYWHECPHGAGYTNNPENPCKSCPPENGDEQRK